MPMLPRTSRLLDRAEKSGFRVVYDEDCGTCQPGLVTITGRHLRKPVFVEVECAPDQGLLFRANRSTYCTLAGTAEALGLAL